MVYTIIQHWCTLKVAYQMCLKVILSQRLRLRTIFSNFSNNFSAGELNEEEEVLQWLITQKTEDRIELITRQMLETMVEETQYLAVYFCKLIEIYKKRIT